MPPWTGLLLYYSRELEAWVVPFHAGSFLPVRLNSIYSACQRVRESRARLSSIRIRIYCASFTGSHYNVCGEPVEEHEDWALLSFEPIRAPQLFLLYESEQRIVLLRCDLSRQDIRKKN